MPTITSSPTVSTGRLSHEEVEELLSALEQESKEQKAESELRSYPAAKRLRSERRKLLPVAVAARVLGVTIEAVGRWVEQGKLQVVIWPDGELKIHTDTLRQLLQPRPLDEEEEQCWWFEE